MSSESKGGELKKSNPPPWFAEALSKAMIDDAFNALPWRRKLRMRILYGLSRLRLYRIPNHTTSQRIAWMKGSHDAL